MEPIFTEDQLKNMSRETLIELMQVMQEKQRKTETKMKLMEEKQKELEFLNAMLSDRLTLAKKQHFGASSEKYADGYEQMNLFNVSAKYCYVTHELRLHQNDRCKRFTLF